MINLEIPKKFKPLINQAFQAADNVFRPVSRKYDKGEHDYPVELDMFSSIMDGMNDALADDAVGTGKLSAKYKGSGVRNGVNMNTVLGLAELCWGGEEP